MRALRVLFLADGAALAVWAPYVAAILLERNFDSAGVGLVIALGAVFSTLGVPGWGHVGDVILGRRRAFQAVALVAAGASAIVGLTLRSTLPELVFAVLFAFLISFQGTFVSLADALAVNAMTDAPRQYGRIRFLSSLSFAVVATVTGFVYDRTGYAPALGLFAVLSIGMVAAVRWVPDVPTVHRRHAEGPRLAAAGAGSGRFGSIGMALREQPGLWPVLLAIVLIYMGVVGGWTFLTIRIVELGGQPSDIALSAAVGAFAEIPGMLLAGRIAARIGLRGLFAGSAALYGLCFASWIVLGTPAALIATRAFCGFALAGLWVGAVLTMASILPDRLQATGQALCQTMAFGVASVIANLAGGWLYATAGYGVVFGLMVVGAIGSIAVAWLAFPRRGEPRGRPVLEASLAEVPLA